MPEGNRVSRSLLDTTPKFALKCRAGKNHQTSFFKKHGVKMKTSLSFFAYSFSLAIVFAIGFQQSNLNAQAAGPEYDIVKKDVGEWDV